MASELVLPDDTLDRHLFVRFRGTGSRYDYDLVNEAGKKLDIPHSETDMSLSQSDIGNYRVISFVSGVTGHHKSELRTAAENRFPMQSQVIRE